MDTHTHTPFRGANIDRPSGASIGPPRGVQTLNPPGGAATVLILFQGASAEVLGPQQLGCSRALRWGCALRCLRGLTGGFPRGAGQQKDRKEKKASRKEKLAEGKGVATSLNRQPPTEEELAAVGAQARIERKPWGTSAARAAAGGNGALVPQGSGPSKLRGDPQGLDAEDLAEAAPPPAAQTVRCLFPNLLCSSFLPPPSLLLCTFLFFSSILPRSPSRSCSAVPRCFSTNSFAPQKPQK